MYLADAEARNPGVLKSQWIPDDETLWTVDRYPEFLAERRALLAAAANKLLDTLRTGRQGQPPNIATPAESPRPGPAPDQTQTLDEDDQDIVAVLSLADELGIAAPEPHCEICNDETGEVITVADIAWPQGIQPGRAAQPVALLLGADPGTKASLGELGYRFFTSRQKLVWHLEELLGVDIDGDEAIGEVETETNNA